MLEYESQIEKKTIKAKPVLKWVGGKTQLLPELTKRLNKVINECDTYIEPFIGAGALFFHLKSNEYLYNTIKKWYISDFNKDLVLLYRVVKYEVYALIKELDIISSKYLKLNDNDRKTFYYDTRAQFNAILNDINYDLFDESSIKRAAYIVFLNKTCFNGLYRVNAKGEFNVPMGKYKNPQILNFNNLINVNNILQNVEINCHNFSDIKYEINEKTFIYFDPPYRPLKENSSFTAYSKCDFDDEMQRNLAKYFKNNHYSSAKMLLSNSDSKLSDKEQDFFDSLYSDFSIERVYALRNVNSKGNLRGKITEILISNF
ncbi:MAG: Dam family site-specific DNA-(adenine-N6)-methyltransferase [Candidatus Muirbacterium halophilum]|nr:Dam family site-specific DNA-(adenine-N6)-methyltransferase [Candidatus Muirbacterium halophilum]MCK9476162.1 Dam family site-specific DNA-(adenine-N6)-methyltransferase [Candidatus Muirbacterium halophilum]